MTDSKYNKTYVVTLTPREGDEGHMPSSFDVYNAMKWFWPELTASVAVRRFGQDEPAVRGSVMSRKDYELIAQAIHLVVDTGKYDMRSLTETAKTIAMFLSQDNARFDSDQFFEACGLI